jgi:hexokinase
VIVKLVLFLAQVNRLVSYSFTHLICLGINACYFENLDNVPKWTGARDQATKQIVINTEWGALGKVSYFVG